MKRTASTFLIIFLCALLLIGCTSINNTSSSADMDQTGTSSATENSAPSNGLDLSVIYYADIVIKDYGTITVQLNQKAAPVTVANFVDLAQSGFYNGLTFHRIIKGFMMQGGDPNGNGTGGSGKTITGEFLVNGFNNTLSHTRGAISMARANPYNSASSQFFIVHQDVSDSLDGFYAVFGYVTDGMDVVDAVCEAAKPINNNGLISAKEQPVITSITIRTTEKQCFDNGVILETCFS